MDSDEGESTNGGNGERVVFVLFQQCVCVRGVSVERLNTSPHYLLELTAEGGKQRRKEGVKRTEKYMEREDGFVRSVSLDI